MAREYFAVVNAVTDRLSLLQRLQSRPIRHGLKGEKTALLRDLVRAGLVELEYEGIDLVWRLAPQEAVR